MLKNDKDLSESRRVRLTKRLIKETLAELLQSKNIRSITVKELCQHAEINRSTFYVHYGDAYAVLEDIERDFLAQMPFSIETIAGNDETAKRHLILEYINYIRDNQTTFIALCKNGMLSNALYEHVLTSHQDIFVPGIHVPELYRFIMCYANTGTCTVLLYWLEEQSFSTEEMAEIILRLLPHPTEILDALSKIGYKPKKAKH